MAEENNGRLNFVCVDDSEFSKTAFNWYVSNFHQPEDCVGFVHVHEMPSLPAMGLIAGGEYFKDIERSVAKAKAMKSEFVQYCKEKGLKFHFYIVDAKSSNGNVICNLAKEKKADTIIMGQRGLGMISRALLGSTSDYVLHHSEVPVVVVPASPKK